jgi:hypothetical protein
MTAMNSSCPVGYVRLIFQSPGDQNTDLGNSCGKNQEIVEEPVICGMLFSLVQSNSAGIFMSRFPVRTFAPEKLFPSCSVMLAFRCPGLLIFSVLNLHLAMAQPSSISP